MQREEAAFLTHPASVFNAVRDRALCLGRERIGPDYFGIECGHDPDGKLVVFEVNASIWFTTTTPNSLPEPVRPRHQASLRCHAAKPRQPRQAYKMPTGACLCKFHWNGRRDQPFVSRSI